MNDPITLAQEFHRTPPPTPLQPITPPQETHPWGHTPPSQLPDTVDELFKTSALLTPEQQQQLVHQAHLPRLVDTPGSGTTECRTADGRTMHVYLPPPPTPNPDTASPLASPLIDKWVVNTSVLSLALSGAAFITAHAAATFIAALQAVAWLALATAIVLGLIVVSAKRPTRPHLHITNHIENTKPFARAHINTPTTLKTGHRRITP